MASWSIFGELYSILVTYYFGTTLALSVTILAVMFISFLIAGAPLRYGLLFILPLSASMAVGGWFGVEGWILNAVLIIIGILYGFIMINMFSR